MQFLSTLSLRRATARRLNSGGQRKKISIHALLAESDRYTYPSSVAVPISIHALLAESDKNLLKLEDNEAYFYPRSPCGERPIPTLIPVMARLFLSTLSLRRATNINGSVTTSDTISIHALLAESDRQHSHLPRILPRISIHALLAESDEQTQTFEITALRISIHALLAESDRYRIRAR